jgi:uncharacterized membrane protein
LRSGVPGSTAVRASPAWRALGVALLLAYPFTVHFARPAAALALLAALAAYVACSFFLEHPLRWLLPPAAAGLAFFSFSDFSFILYLPPIAVNLALCWLFGRTLARGRQPLIARFAALEQGTLTDELASYARLITWLWTLLFALAALASVGLALSGSRDAWSLFTNFINYGLVAALFLGEYAYRRLRFRNYRHQSLAEFLRNLRRVRLLER